MALVPITIQLLAINRPYGGHFGQYQGNVMAVMAENMLEENFAEWYLPKTNLIIGQKRSLHLNQYPFPSLIVALMVKVSDVSFEVAGRLQAMFFNFFSGLLVFLLCQKLISREGGVFGAFLYFWSPYTIIYGQAFMSEPMSLFFLLLSFWLIVRNPSSWKSIFIAGLSMGLSVTGRVHYGIYATTPLLYIYLYSSSKKTLKSFVFAFCASLFPLVWYGFTFFTAANRDNVLTTLFLQIGIRQAGDSHYLLNPEYYVHLVEIMLRMFTPIFFAFPLIGLLLLRSDKKIKLLSVSGVLFSVFIIILYPQKIMDHDFYLYPLFIFLVLPAAFALHRIWIAAGEIRSALFICIVCLLTLGLSARYFLHPVFKNESSVEDVVRAGAAIREITTVTDKIIVAEKGTSTILFYAGRPAWVISLDPHATLKLAPYLKEQTGTRIDHQELAALEFSMQNKISWFEYLKKQGAKWMVIPQKDDLNSFPEFYDYLKHSAQLVSDTSEPYSVYKL